MDKRKVVSAMLHEIADMSTEEFIFFCIMLKASCPEELKDRVEFVIQAIKRIRKKKRRRDIIKAVYKRRLFHAGIRFNSKNRI